MKQQSKEIDLMIVGVEKAGTTALYRHLCQSPRVLGHKQREMFYFLSEHEYSCGWAYALEKYFSGGKEGFLFAKNAMQINSDLAMQRLKCQCPDTKIIVMLREPAARAYSAYHYATLRGIEDCSSFEEALALEGSRLKASSNLWNPLFYLYNSTYAPKLKATIELFGRDNVLVLFHEEYKNSPHRQLERIEKFLGHRLFGDIDLNLKEYNLSARAKYPWLAKRLYTFLQSRGPFKKFMRSILSHEAAVRLRHVVLDFNRVEASYEPLNENTARAIHRKLSTDIEMIIDLVGYCPWEEK